MSGPDDASGRQHTERHDEPAAGGHPVEPADDRHWQYPAAPTAPWPAEPQAQYTDPWNYGAPPAAIPPAPPGPFNPVGLPGPGQGPLGPAGPVGPPRPRGRTAGVLFGIMAGLSLIVAAVFLTLYVTERSTHDRTQQELTSQREELDGVRAKLDATEQKERYQQNRIAELENHNAELRECADTTTQFFTALDEGDDAKIDRAITEMFQTC